jgi:PIN domain nuclease of toxin-antitoxin system
MLDASAILAVLNQEERAEKVMSLEGAAVSAVNLAEVVTKLSQKGVPEPEMRRVLALLDLEVIPFDERAAYRAGALHRLASSQGCRWEIAPALLPLRS